MRIILTLLTCGLASVDYSTWHSPIVLSGTCNEVSADGKCSSLSVWYVYKGKGLIPSSVMSQKSSNGFDTNVIHALDASAIPKFGLHQTRVLYGSIVKDTFVLEPLANTVFLKNLDRVVNLVRIQESNPNLTEAELKASGYDISFPASGKSVPSSHRTPPTEPVVPDLPVPDLQVPDLPVPDSTNAPVQPDIVSANPVVTTTAIPAVTNKPIEPEPVEPAPVEPSMVSPESEVVTDPPKATPEPVEEVTTPPASDPMTDPPTPDTDYDLTMDPSDYYSPEDNAEYNLPTDYVEPVEPVEPVDEDIEPVEATTEPMKTTTEPVEATTVSVPSEIVDTSDVPVDSSVDSPVDSDAPGMEDYTIDEPVTDEPVTTTGTIVEPPIVNPNELKTPKDVTIATSTELPLPEATTEEPMNELVTLEMAQATPDCIYSTWEEWSDCDCSASPPIRTRLESGFPEALCDNHLETERGTCEEECLIIVYPESSGDSRYETSGDGSDDTEIDRDESSDEDSYDRDDSESSDYGTEELSRLTRDRYRRRVEDDLAELNENEFDELYLTS